MAVAYVDLSRLDPAAIFRHLEKMPGADPESLAFSKKEGLHLVKTLTDGGVRGCYLLFSLAQLPEGPPVVVLPLPPEKDGKELAAALGKEKLPGLHFEARDGVVIGASRRALRHLRALKPAARPDLARALADADGAVQVALSPGAVLRRALEEALPELPAELGKGSITVFTRGGRWLALGLTPPPKAEMRLTVQAADAAAARSLQKAAVNLFKAFGKEKAVRVALPDFDKLGLTPQVVGDRLTLVVKEDGLFRLLLPLIQDAFQAALRSKDANNLKDLGIALHTYHDAHKHFPAAASTDRQKRPLLSWRIALLPYVGEHKLYKEFHLNEPWDSEHNKKLIERMPKVFVSAASPRLAATGKTAYLGPVGPATFFPGTQPIRIGDVTDGTSNTIMLVEADDKHAVVWTKPEDLNVDLTNPARGLRRRGGKTFLVLLADGSVHSLPANISKTTLRSLFTINGGEVLGSDFR